MHEPYLRRLLGRRADRPRARRLRRDRGPFLAYLVLLLAAIPLVLARRRARRPGASSPPTGPPCARGASGSPRAAILFAELALGVLEGVLPLHLAERLTQAEIGALYVGASLVVATSAAAAGSCARGRWCSPRSLLAVAGHLARGDGGEVPLWVLALRWPALGVGIGNTGSLGLLVEAVRSSGSSPRWSSGRRSASPATCSARCRRRGRRGPGFAYVGLVPAAAGGSWCLPSWPRLPLTGRRAGHTLGMRSLGARSRGHRPRAPTGARQPATARPGRCGVR